VAPPAPPSKEEAVSTDDNKHSRKNDGARKEKGGRGGRGNDSRPDRDGARKGGAGRGEKTRSPRAAGAPEGAGKGNKKGKAAAQSASGSGDPVADKSRKEAENEQAALLKFQRAQEKLAQKDSLAHQQAAKKGSSQVVNAFNALALDDSDDENSS